MAAEKAMMDQEASRFGGAHEICERAPRMSQGAECIVLDDKIEAISATHLRRLGTER